MAVAAVVLLIAASLAATADAQVSPCIGPSVGQSPESTFGDCPADNTTVMSAALDKWGNLFYIATSTTTLGGSQEGVRYRSVVRMVSPDGTCRVVIGSPATSSNGSYATFATFGGGSYSTFAVYSFLYGNSPLGESLLGYNKPCGGLSMGSDIMLPSATNDAVCLNLPLNLITDYATGDVLLSDTFNHRILRLNVETGTLVTVAGSSKGWSDAGSVNCSTDFGPSPATSACLNLPTGLMLDSVSKDLFFVDSGNGLIRSVSASNNIITTLVGASCNPSLPLSWDTICLSRFPGSGIAAYQNGFLVADSFNHRVLQFLRGTTPGTSTVLVVASSDYTDPSYFSSLSDAWVSPRSIYTTPSGDIYVSDLSISLNDAVQTTSGVVRLLLPSPSLPRSYKTVFTSEPTPLADSFSLVTPSLSEPIFNFSCGEPIILEAFQGAINLISTKGAVCRPFAVPNITTGYGGDGGLSRDAKLNKPLGLAFGPDNTMYIADSGNGRVRRVLVDGTIVTVAGGGNESGDGVAATAVLLRNPASVSVSAWGDLYKRKGGSLAIFQAHRPYVSFATGLYRRSSGGFTTRTPAHFVLQVSYSSYHRGVSSA